MIAPTASSQPSGNRIDAGNAGWLSPLRDWPDAAIRSLHSAGVVTRAVVASVRGSAPREAGACMLVAHDHIRGTIGGGRLEWTAIDAARSLLKDLSAPPVRVQKVILGAQLAQCCGGVVELWIERYTVADLRLLEEAARSMRHGRAILVGRLTHDRVERQVVRASLSGVLRLPRAHARVHIVRTTEDHTSLWERLDEDMPPLWLYGSGHVGQALVRILAELPVRVTWVDSRAELLPGNVPDNICVMHAANPLDTVSHAPPGAYFLVMTHSHPLDYALCRAVLERGDFAWAGVIGSNSKAARFRSRLGNDGLAADAIARLACPIGIEGITTKSPAVIAVAVAAQLLQTLEFTTVARDDARAAAGQSACLVEGQSPDACSACRLQLPP